MSAHDHAEEFPREATAALVGSALDSERRRWRIQVALVSLGVTALVLGLPTRSLFGYRMLEMWPTERGEWTGLHLLPAVVARALTALTHWRAYQSWYLVSALAAVDSLRSKGFAPARPIGIVHFGDEDLSLRHQRDKIEASSVASAANYPMISQTMIQARVAATTLTANTSGKSHLRSRHRTNVRSCNNDVLGATKPSANVENNRATIITRLPSTMSP